MVDTTELVKKIVTSLTLPRCSLFKHAVLTRATENSDVWSFPILIFREVVKSALGAKKGQEVGFHFINVNGPRPAVSLHYHISHVMGFVAAGKGLLFCETDGQEVCHPITAGDIFVFPQNVNHLLATQRREEECHCVTFEFGSKLDYQAHHN